MISDQDLKRLTEQRVVEFHGNSYLVRCDPSSDSIASWWSFVDEQDIRNQWWNIKTGDVVFDIGAAFGSYALAALSAGAKRVYAWSPEDTWKVLQLNLKQNEGWLNKCVTFTDGLWSRKGFISASMTSQMPTFHSNLADCLAKVNAENGVWMEVDSLDATMEKYRLHVDKIDWIKMDVEGAEVEVLRGAVETVKKFKPKLFIENHIFKKTTLREEFWELLDSFGVGYVEVGTVPYASISHSLYVVP